MGNIKVVQSEIEFNMWVYDDTVEMVSLGKTNSPLRKALLCLPYAQRIGVEAKGGFVHFKCPMEKYTSDMLTHLRRGIISIVNFFRITKKITFQDINQVVRSCYPEFEFVVQAYSSKKAFSYVLFPTAYVVSYPTERDLAILNVPNTKSTINLKKGERAGDIPLHKWLALAEGVEAHVEDFLNPKKKKLSGKKKTLPKKKRKK